MKRRTNTQKYNFTFDKNEIKILKTFCNQTLNQIEYDERYFNETTVFKSIVEKLNSGEAETKFTKKEKLALTKSIKANIEGLEDQLKKAGFLKRWLLKSVYKQYQTILENHFND